MTEPRDIYPYTLRCRGGDTILMWSTGEAERDSFLLLPTGELLSAESMPQMRRKLNPGSSDTVHWDEAAEFDLDEFLSALAALAPQRRLAAGTCAILLEGWNLLEDLVASLAGDMASLESGATASIYDKLFFGNNLSAMRGEGKVYHPTLSAGEVATLRSLMASYMRYASERAPQLGLTPP